MVWNVAQRAADGLYSNVWISDAFHELLRSVGCHPAGLAKRKAWKIASRDCVCSHFSWATWMPCSSLQQNNPNIRKAWDLFCWTTQLLWPHHSPAGTSGDREAEEHHTRRVILTSSPTSADFWNLGQTAHISVLKSKLSESSLFQFSQRKENGTHSQTQAGTTGWLIQAKAAHVSHLLLRHSVSN